MSDVKTREAGDVFVPAQEEVKGLLSTEEDTTMGATAPAITNGMPLSRVQGFAWIEFMRTLASGSHGSTMLPVQRAVNVETPTMLS